MNHENYMKLALEEAEKAFREDEVPVGAVGVIGDEVVARTHNRRERDQSPLSHAEIQILSEASGKFKNWRLEGLTIYVTLEPCIMCTGAMLQARTRRLVFGAMDPKAGACGSIYDLSNDNRLNHRIEVISGIMADESKKLLQEFFKNKRSHPTSS